MSNIDPKCDACDGDLEGVYQPVSTLREVVVCVCQNCGLVQSVAHKKPTGRIVSTSCDADYGNLRSCKGLRLDAHKRVLDGLPWDGIETVLDVGASRGAFVDWMWQHHREATVVAVEPDASLITSGLVIPCHLEHANLSEDEYDLVYCVHTLEHADSAKAMLETIVSVMREGAYLLLEVPNITAINAEDVVEEFFVDKHNFHFNHKPLFTMLENLGLTIKHGGLSQNITLLLQKTGRPVIPKYRTPVTYSMVDHDLAAHNRTMIAEYAKRLKANRARLPKVVEKIHWMAARQSVAVWGGGRLFESLRTYGGLDRVRLSCVVDEALCKILPDDEYASSDRLRTNPPQTVIVLARSGVPDIKAKLQAMGIRGGQIVAWNDLFASVQ